MDLTEFEQARRMVKDLVGDGFVDEYVDYHARRMVNALRMGRESEQLRTMKEDLGMYR